MRSFVYRFFQPFDVIGMFDHGDIVVPTNLQGRLVSGRDITPPAPLADKPDLPEAPKTRGPTKVVRQKVR